VGLGRQHRRQGHKVHIHLLGQRQFFGVMAGSRQPAVFWQWTALGGVLAQLCSGQVPASRREIPQPLQRPLEHQLRLGSTQPGGVHRQVTVLGVIAIGRSQRNQLGAASNGLLDTAQQLRGFQAIRGNQVLIGQAGSGNNGLVGLRKLVARQLALTDPSQGLTFCPMWFASKIRHFPHIEQDMLVGVVMLNLDQRSGSLDHNTQLLLQLAPQRRFHRLTRLDLAAGKLPEAALMLSVSATGDQNLAVCAPDNGRSHMNSFHPCTSSNPACCQALNAGHW